MNRRSNDENGSCTGEWGWLSVSRRQKVTDQNLLVFPKSVTRREGRNNFRETRQRVIFFHSFYHYMMSWHQNQHYSIKKYKEWATIELIVFFATIRSGSWTPEVFNMSGLVTIGMVCIAMLKGQKEPMNCIWNLYSWVLSIMPIACIFLC